MAPSTAAEPPWWWRPREAIIALFLLAALVVAQTTPSVHASHGVVAEGADGTLNSDRTSALTSDRKTLEPGGRGEESETAEAGAGGDGSGGGGGDGGGDGGGSGDVGEGAVAEGGGAGDGGGSEGMDGGDVDVTDGGTDQSQSSSSLQGTGDGDGSNSGNSGGDGGDGDVGGNGGGDAQQSPGTAVPATTTKAGWASLKNGADLPDLPAEDPRRKLRIALVANGKSTLNHKFGTDIDAHDLVGGLHKLNPVRPIA
jgi:hypothetical protein